MTSGRELCHLAGMRRTVIASILVVASVAAAERVADPLWVLLQAKDRTDEDRKNDESRKPLELLRFMDVKPGMKVADLGAGSGYLTELLVRAVGPSGKVYAQNSQEAVDKFLGKTWDERLARPVNKGVVRVVRPIDDPLPPDAKDLDLVTVGFFYHDTVWLGADRDKLNRAIFAALKPGGHYVVMDHAGRPGTGSTETKTLHRIEEKTVL